MFTDTCIIGTSSSMATLPATRIACDQLGADADESTPFYTIGATVNMVGTLMGLTLISLYGMQAYGVETSIADRFVVALQSMVYATSAAGVPSGMDVSRSAIPSWSSPAFSSLVEHIMP